MEFVSASIGVVLLLFIGITAGLIVLEIFLARSEKWWPGLIPPLFTFLWALFICLLNASAMNDLGMGGVAGAVISGVLVLNVPTWILLIIYFIFRAKKRKQKMLDKMNLHDLN